MPKDRNAVRMICAVLGLVVAPSQPFAQGLALPPALERIVESHPHVRRVSDWGSRADWSPDGKRLLFVSRQFGDVFELDVASGKTRPLTFHFSHDGFLRAYYLKNGDILLTGQRDHTPGVDGFGRVYDSQMSVMKADLSQAPVPLGAYNIEGVAVSRENMRIAWARPAEPRPSKFTDADAATASTRERLAGHANQIWTADIDAGNGTSKMTNPRMVLDCKSSEGALAEMARRAGGTCMLIEPQNFVPTDDARLTFTMLTLVEKSRIEVNSYIMDLRSGKIAEIESTPAYAEVEGVFPDGKSTLVEYYQGPDIEHATQKIDLWKLALDGSGKLQRLTRFNELDPQLKANQGIISPDGRWMAFGVATDEIEKRVQGQGVGIFLMDLKAAGF